MKRLEKFTFRTIHTDYLRFAVLSYLDSQKEADHNHSDPYVNRHVVETIRYSFDCLDAAIKFIYLIGSTGQLPITIPTNWLTRYMQRQWSGLSLSDSIGLLSFSWTGQAFWQTSEQHQLFEDLRKLRGGLTHPKPIGTSVFRLPDQSTVEELLEPRFLVHSKPIAQFHESLTLLDDSDAGQALAIMLHHLMRIDQLFLQGTYSTQFAYHDQETNEIRGATRLLQLVNCRFAEYWQ